MVKPHDLPKAISEGVVTLCGVDIRVSVLDTGERILHAEDVHRLFDAWADGVLMTESETLEFAQAVRGVGAWDLRRRENEG